jgi:hypothetical protein
MFTATKSGMFQVNARCAFVTCCAVRLATHNKVALIGTAPLAQSSVQDLEKC